METPSARPIILVIDSDPLNMTALAAALHLSGYEAHSARNRESAMKAAQRLALDLVICDVNLDGASGLELCQDIKLTDANRETPLMFLSSSQAPDIIRRTLDSEGVFFLRKPFDPSVLLDFVERALWMPHLVNTHLYRNETDPSANPAATPRRVSPSPISQWHINSVDQPTRRAMSRPTESENQPFSF